MRDVVVFRLLEASSLEVYGSFPRSQFVTANNLYLYHFHVQPCKNNWLHSFEYSSLGGLDSINSLRNVRFLRKASRQQNAAKIVEAAAQTVDKSQVTRLQHAVKVAIS